MGTTLRIVNPLHDANWDGALQRHPGAGVFHTAAWARVLSDCYAYLPAYIVAETDGALRAVLPVMEVRSWLTGRRGIALPFSDYLMPLSDDAELLAQLSDAAVAYGRTRQWRYLELRGPVEAAVAQADSYYAHELALAELDSAQLWQQLASSTRRNIRSAERAGVVVRQAHGPGAVAEFQRLNALTRRRHGLPPQPAGFFAALQRHLLAEQQGSLFLASWGNQSVAGAVFLHFGRNAMYKYGASDARHQKLRANDLVMWTALQWYQQQGCACLSLGRTAPHNAGLLRFKDNWGARRSALQYRRYDYTRNCFVDQLPERRPMVNAVFQRMPIGLAQLVGELLYRHVA